MKRQNSPWAPILAGLMLGVVAAVLVSLARAERFGSSEPESTPDVVEPRTAPRDERVVEAEMVLLTNRERRRAGLPELRVDDGLTEAARGHSRMMARHHDLAHGFPGEPELGQRLAEAKVRFDSAGENVSYTDDDDPAPSSHAGLMASPGHRANILGRNFDSLGIGVVRRDGAFYITEDFARAFAPLSAHEVEEAMTRLVNQLRRRQNRAPLRVEHLQRLEHLSCELDVTPDKLLNKLAGSLGAQVFTTFLVSDLPKGTERMVMNPSITAVQVKVCPMPPSRGGNGGYEVWIVFFGDPT